MWGDNGVTVGHFLLDQQPSLAAWGASQIRLPTRALTTAGYLRNIRLFLSGVSSVGTTTLGGGTAAGQSALQLGAYRSIARFQLNLQGVAQIYDVRGEDLYFLAYVRNGRYNQPNFATQYLITDTGTDTTAINTGNAVNKFLTATKFDGSSNPTLTFYADIPITEWVRFKDSVVAGNQGAVVVTDREMEIGLITLQNTQSNVSPVVLLNPLYSTTAPNAPVLTTGAATVTMAPTWNIGVDIYDVPKLMTDQPPAASQSFIITRQNVETVVSGGSATTTFRQAGLLLRALYALYDSSDNLLDISSLANTGTLTMQWGATMIKHQETLQENLARMAKRYGPAVAPPAGLLCHDFFVDDGTLIEPINTADIVNLRTLWKGLTGVATIRTIEERMVPVRAA